VAQKRQRVITNSTIDDRSIQPHHLQEMVAVVEEEFGRNVVQPV